MNRIKSILKETKKALNVTSYELSALIGTEEKTLEAYLAGTREPERPTGHLIHIIFRAATEGEFTVTREELGIDEKTLEAYLAVIRRPKRQTGHMMHIIFIAATKGEFTVTREELLEAVGR